MVEKFKQWWGQDLLRSGLILGVFAYALFFAQGIPFWDDDFTSWFWKIKDNSLFHYIWEWISPISTQPQYWGFNERPLQSIAYKICYLIAGYDAWPYTIFKSLVYAGVGGMIYTWARRLVPNTKFGKHAAAAAAVFFVVAPGPMAAHIMYQDFAPVAELLFLVITYVIWGEIEKTPVAWQGFPKWSDPENKRWIRRWAGISVMTYLAYKSKADLKLIPAILAAYVLVVPERRKQWGFFAVPIALMALLAVPWGPGIFTKLPPFVPGSKGSEIGWMWQPASVGRMFEFLWAQGGLDWKGFASSSTISLAGLLGPFLLVGMAGFLVWKMEAFDKVKWTTQETTVDRARTFALIWFVVILAGTSALPAINYTFRIRYGIITLVPTSLLLAWVFGLFSTSVEKLPKWAAVGALALFVLQSGINLNRSITYRRSMGQVMVAVDQVYEDLNKSHPDSTLALMPDFRPYDYRPDSGPAIEKRTWLSQTEQIASTPIGSYTISWKPSLWPAVEQVAAFSGCRSTSLFDHVFPCEPGTGAFLMKYIGVDPLYDQGEQLRSKGDIAGAKRIHEQFLEKYPESMAGHFVVGLEAFQLKQWEESEHSYAMLEKYFPTHLSILYNHALALSELKQYRAAIDRLQYIVAREPANYAALINLYYSYIKDGNNSGAKHTLTAMKRSFPSDGEVNRLLAGS